MQNQMKAYQQGPQQGPGQGYDQVPQPGSPTYTEAWALIEAARRMARAIESGDLEDMSIRNKVREAFRLNWRLWTIFQAHLTVGNRQVPEEVRVNMLSLCKFVDNHTVESMTKPSPEKVATLIDINRNIASGLLASLEVTAKDAEEPTEEPVQGDEEVTSEPVATEPDIGSIN